MPKKKSKESEEEFDIKEFGEIDKLKFDKDILDEEDEADQNKEDEKVEESELEEDVGINLNNLGEMEFSQFIQSSEPLMDKAPVLERIAGSQPGPIFVGGMSQTPVNVAGEEEKTDEFKYVPGRAGNDEPKYIASDSRFSTELTPIDLMKVGRRQTELVPQVNQETFFRRSEPGSQVESPTPERQWTTERIDTGRAGREDPFKREEVKYEKYKPKTPKSY